MSGTRTPKAAQSARKDMSRGRRGETSTMTSTERVLNYKHKPREPKLTQQDRPSFRKGPRWREAVRSPPKQR